MSLMRLSFRAFCALVLGATLLSVISYWAINANYSESKYAANLLDNTLQGIRLAIPPAYAIESTTTMPPLNTSQISLFAYHQQIGGWTLADTVPAFVSYFDGGNYYEGYVRVWDVGIGASGSGDYIDVRVRVRADGWILAWLNKSIDDSGAIVWWGHRQMETGFPISYSTTLSRALNIVYYVSGVDFPGYDQISMYDYSEPNATRLLIFGDSFASSWKRTFYYTIPANSTIEVNKFLIRAGGGGHNSLWVDGYLMYDYGGPNAWGWETIQLIDEKFLTKGVQHSVSGSSSSSSSHNVACIMWIG